MWQIYENEHHFQQGEEGWKRVKHAFTYDLRRWARRYREAKYDAFRRRYPIAFMKREIQNYELLPYYTPYLIIGGGLTGSSIAYWLKAGLRINDLTVHVIESPEKLSKSRSMLGSGVITQQFSIPEMVDLAMFSAEFIRHAGEHLKILDNDPPEINFLPVGVMHLARTDEKAEAFKRAWKIQVERGAHVILLGREELKARFPFMNFDDVVLGTFGLENEGIFDTWQLLSALREKNMSLGVNYIKADFEGIAYKDPLFNRPTGQIHGGMKVSESNLAEMAKFGLQGAIIRPQMSGASARPIICSELFNAAGPWAGEIALKGGIGGDKGDLMRVPIPIVCTRRTNYILHAPDVPTLQMPILLDHNGVICRPDNIGHNYVCSRKPTKKDAIKMLKEKHEDSPPIDYNEFYENIWPLLVQRVPSFKTAKVINAWHSYEDVNIFDDAPIIGEHIVHDRFIQACGFGGYGPQMSIAVGRSIVERVKEVAYTTINLRKFDQRRVMHGQKFTELFRCV